MIHRILTIFLTAFCCLFSVAQDEGKNIYIYRNDGKFSAFMAHEVDSLRYSKIDFDGVEHKHNVMQEIWTPDSVYRIPLSVIDSISVLTPEIKYTPQLKLLNPDYTPYITRVDGLEIDFSLNLPYNLHIKKGDVLLYDKFDDLFEDGFAGRVVSLTNDNAIKVKCEPVELSDIYEQYIAVGEITVSPQKNMAPPAHAKASWNHSLNIDLSVGDHFKGALTMEAAVKVVAFINRENTYLELQFAQNNNLQFGLSLEGQLKKETETPHVSFPLTQPISLVSLTADAYVGIYASLAGSLNFNISKEWGSKRSIIYDNGRWSAPHPQNTNTPFSVDATAKADGEIWLGVAFQPTIKTVGNIVSFGVVNTIGPALEFEFENSLSELKPDNAYNILKNATTTLALRYQCKLQGQALAKKVDFEVSPKRNLWEQKFYLVPEFSDIVLETDTKQISAKASVSRLLFSPCQIGFCVLDEDDNEIDSFYDSEYKGFLKGDYELKTSFSKNLNPGVKYKVRPMVKWLGMDIMAHPEEETYLDSNIQTGKANSTTYSVEVSGSVEQELKPDTEVGFVYSASDKNPTAENSSISKGQMINANTFMGGFSGLRQGTTYYYKAYAFYNDKYYYGDAQCITTKKNIDHNDDDNFGGDFKNGLKPYASTGMSYDVGQREGKVELTFSCVSPDTECGYYIEADDRKGKRILSKYNSLGTVTGVYTVELDNLIPGTTYRYWASEKNSAGSSTGIHRTFKTEPSPDPTGTILDVVDIDMKSATVKCYFDNMESDYEYGIILSDDKWSYSKIVKPDAAGNASVKLDRLVAETDYQVKTYISTDSEDDLIIEKQATNFSTIGPDITGQWSITMNGYSGGTHYDLEFYSNGRTNNFYGVNYLIWERKGRSITLRSAYSGGTSTAANVYRGEFNEDFTEATGNGYYVNTALEDKVLIDIGPFTLRRK